jgi:hypothetical protein
MAAVDNFTSKIENSITSIGNFTYLICDFVSKIDNLTIALLSRVRHATNW